MFLIACKQKQEKNQDASNLEGFYYEILTNSDGTYGYTIFKEKKPLIIQEFRPGVKGTLGFVKRRHAVDVVKLVISKIKDGEFPPTVVKEEIDSILAK
ncbi:DUF4907 domain-containing protein [Fulvivirga sp. 29W222]|uniref:DUF4907 domain-containing protein n=1 Tax=Fulvivirga marina TaxID=2494733 RepID=A0A937FY84_9BACT|nr:DUF4907 domain-containing protein [Fulvivirga marina]MBL6448330.1 DUF4907 domain-containing protein [Fulvivirga marina]